MCKTIQGNVIINNYVLQNSIKFVQVISALL